MKRGRTVVDFLRDMIEYAEVASRLVHGVDYDAFRTNTEKTLAVVRCLEVIGEASTNVPSEVRDGHPAVPWSRVIGMRNIVIHGYFGVDLRVIWDTVADDLPPLREAVARMLADIERSPDPAA